MIPELGQMALALALATALLQTAMPLLGAWRGHARWMALARPAARVQALFVAIAFACLTQAFVVNDFSVAYVVTHSNSALPLAYRVAAVWGGHEGSILLWVLMLAGWSVAVSVFSRRLPLAMLARILAVMGGLSVGLLLFTLFTSNPFVRQWPAALDGQDLNPLLQDPGMVLHPPLLYMGYVGLSVAFAFAVAALITGRLDTAWARWSRPWVSVAWCFLTLGIALGSAWAYYELGWGGWWFWDPVENASFMPWLLATALMHSLAVTEKRGGFRMWTALLAIAAFSLSLLGTFLVRSGVLSSVHAFAVDPARGVFILAFLAGVVGASLALFAWRAPRAAGGGSFDLLSREALLLANNVLLSVAAAAVLLGTLYPLLLDALGGGKLSVGPPYFEAVFVPLVAPALFLMGVGPLARWRSATVPELARRLRWAMGSAVLATLLALLLLGRWTPLVGLGLLLAAWIGISSLQHWVAPLRKHPLREWPRRWAALPAGMHGMLLAHAGIAVFIAGVTLVKGFESERDVRMGLGETTQVAGYTVRFEGIAEHAGANYIAARARLSVMRDGRPVAVLTPEKRLYTASRLPMTEASIDIGFTRDLYAALGEPIDATSWGVRIHHKPFVSWIWGGCLLMALGGALAAADRRYRVGKSAVATEPACAPAAPAQPARPASVAA